MVSLFQQRIALLDTPEQRPLLKGMRRGLEKESLRTDAQGRLALTPHPVGLGSAFAHSEITTDFSEALLEFITPVCETTDEVIAALERIHRFTYSQLGAEQLWTASMPCLLPPTDDDIPLAQYGTSHSARMKTLYRRGLGFRYGRSMQTIAGIHYNVSFPTALWDVLQAHEGLGISQQSYINRGHFGLIRNFRRFSWLLIYLFGASPAVSDCFVRDTEHHLQSFGERTWYLPAATCLRMGDLGYRSAAQRKLSVCFNSLDSYISTLKEGITQSYPDYERIGLRDDAGEYKQLSTSLLQIENEFYGSIRPKRVTRAGEIPLAALQRDGVEYIEVRCLDLNPYHPLGIDALSLDFVDAFLLFCLLSDSPQCDDVERSRIGENIQKVVNRGRDQNLMLANDTGEVSFQSWAQACMDNIRACAELLDKLNGTDRYHQAWTQQQAKLSDVSKTPSAQMMDDIQQYGSFDAFVLSQSQQHAQRFAQNPLSQEQQQRYAALAVASIEKQHQIEAQETRTFDAYLAEFFAQYQQL